MAKTSALSLLTSDGATADTLREVYASFIDQIQQASLSAGIKNTNLSGDPLAGSVEVRRLMTSTVRAYGAARTAAEGDSIANNGVTINLDQRKEIVEEVNRFDLDQYGLAGLLESRSANMALAMARHLDSAFFTEAEAEGEEVTVTGTDLEDKVEEVIQDLETESNDNVDGVDRELMVMTLTPSAYGELENYIDTLPNPTNGGVDVSYFHRVMVLSNTRQTEDCILMTMGNAGAIAQPVAIKDLILTDIPLSAEKALGLFFNYGTEAVAPDLIRYADLGTGTESA